MTNKCRHQVLIVRANGEWQAVSRIDPQEPHDVMWFLWNIHFVIVGWQDIAITISDADDVFSVMMLVGLFSCV